MDRSWEYVNRSQTHEEIGIEAAKFPEKEDINEIFIAVCGKQILASIGTSIWKTGD